MNILYNGIMLTSLEISIKNMVDNYFRRIIIPHIVEKFKSAAC